MNRQAVAIVSIALLMVFGAFLVPTLMSVTEDPQTLETRLEPGQTETVTDGLEVTLNNSTDTTADVRMTDAETDREQSLMVAQGTTESYNLTGGSGNVTAVETTPTAATLEIDYDPMYGWSPAAQTIIDNLGLILTMLLFLVLMGGLKVMVS